MALEAALEAERLHMASQSERRRMVELEPQQARCEAALAERRYAACDPANRLSAAQLEKSWAAALRRVADGEARLDAQRRRTRPPPPRRTSPRSPAISRPPGPRPGPAGAPASGSCAP